ncbi:M48 family metallopeptidase [bacterium]|nr:M48 family metallopeptidase [bacterium]
MSTKKAYLNVSGLKIEVVRKSIKNLHLAVYPPDGRVRVAAPESMKDDSIRLAVINKLGWIKKQKKQFASQSRQTARKYVTGETHYFFGRKYRLSLIEQARPSYVKVVGQSKLELSVRPESTVEQREKVVDRWLRDALKLEIQPLIDKWEPVVGVEVADWGVRRMKTKWGSCKIESKRIWINLELAKKPVECLEYIVVHELAHLHERNHNDRFVAIMDKCLPKWRSLRKLLNSSPLAHEDWTY